MSDIVKVAWITGFFGTLNLLVLWLIKRDVRAVHIATNSLQDKLMDKTEKEALARGTKEGFAAGQKSEKDNPTNARESG